MDSEVINRLRIVAEKVKRLPDAIQGSRSQPEWAVIKEYKELTSPDRILTLLDEYEEFYENQAGG
jgi:hypothetical protein